MFWKEGDAHIYLLCVRRTDDTEQSFWPGDRWLHAAPPPLRPFLTIPSHLFRVAAFLFWTRVCMHASENQSHSQFPELINFTTGFISFSDPDVLISISIRGAKAGADCVGNPSSQEAVSEGQKAPQRTRIGNIVFKDRGLKAFSRVDYTVGDC